MIRYGIWGSGRGCWGEGLCSLQDWICTANGSSQALGHRGQQGVSGAEARDHGS
jgi:hypothetical protein